MKENETEKMGDSVNYGQDVREQFTVNPSFPFLVSFPRTGSHWLRMLMELYFEKPALSRAFFYKNLVGFTCYHRHDNDLSIERENVIYLYRDPVPTVFSQMMYRNENIYDVSRVEYWVKAYARHLEKWLVNETFTKKKTVVSYEGLRNNLHIEFKKITDHFEILFDGEKLDAVSLMTSKKALQKRSKHDKKVVSISAGYEMQRKAFQTNYKEFVLSILHDNNSTLYDFIYM